ncbi:hypothetical protein IWX90DRAFT_445928 [Phyllosticta citrichinensis]|uniref:Uncharacterized protein n=1 Tax=Phyllosticta citrichinensis TaxID=1130410 RepID=A0ABR1XFJ9_9PEZI
MSASHDDGDPLERRQARAKEVTETTFCGVIVDEDGPRTPIKWGSRAHYMATILVWMAQRAYTPEMHLSLSDCDSLFEKFGISSDQLPYSTEATKALQISLVQYMNETVWNDLRTNHVVSGKGWDPRAKMAWARRDWDGRDLSLTHLNKVRPSSTLRPATYLAIQQRSCRRQKVLPVGTPLKKDKDKASSAVADDHRSPKEKYDAARTELNDLQTQFQHHFEEQRNQFIFYRQDHKRCKNMYKQHASKYKDMIAEYLSKTEVMLRTWEETHFATITNEMFETNS